MEFIRGIPLESASGKVRKLYENDLKTLGYVANSTKIFALRPEVHGAWLKLIEAIRTNMQPRRYELIALAVEVQLRTDALKPGREVSAEELEAIAREHGYGDLTAAESLMMMFAACVAVRANTIHDTQVTGLRVQGFSDAEILDIGLAASSRSFWSKTLDAVGGEPDEQYMTLDEGFRRAVVTARPVETTGTTLAVPVVRPDGRFQPRAGGHARVWRDPITVGVVLLVLGGLVGVGAVSRVSLRQYAERLRSGIAPASQPAPAPPAPAPAAPAPVPAAPGPAQPVSAPPPPAVAPVPAASPDTTAVTPAVTPAAVAPPRVTSTVSTPAQAPKPAGVVTPPELPKAITHAPSPPRGGGPAKSVGSVARTPGAPAAKAGAVRPDDGDEPKGDAADRGPDPISVRDFLRSLSPTELGAKDQR